MSSLKDLAVLGKELGYKDDELRKFVSEEQEKERLARLNERQAEKEKFELARQAEKEKLELEKEKFELARQAEKEKLELENKNLELARQAEREKFELARHAEKEKYELENRRIELDRAAEKHKLEIELEMEKDKIEADRVRADEEHKRALEVAGMEHQRAIELAELAKDSKPSVSKSGGVSHVKGPKLPPFEADTDNMDSYLSRFERYAQVQGWEPNQWSLHLSALLKGKALDVYSRLPFDDSLDYDKLKVALLKRFELTEEGFRTRFKFAKPEKGETFVQFLRRSRNYLDRWLELGHVEQTYEAVTDYLIRDQLLGICSRELYVFLKEKQFTQSNDMAIQADLFSEVRGGAQNVVTRDSKGFNGSKNPTPVFPRQNRDYSRKVAPYRKCNNCGMTNHRAEDCRRRNDKVAMVSDERPNSTFYEFRGRGNFRPRSRLRGRGRGYPPRGEGNCCVSDTDDTWEELGALSDRNCPSKAGRLNGRPVEVMRDTGSTCVVVRRELVASDQFLGKDRACRYIDGSVRYFPLAMVEIDCPYFSGRTEALCVDNAMYDVVLGNIAGAKYPESNDVVVQAVETRSQAKQKPYRKLGVPSPVLDMSSQEFAEKQTNDKGLDKLRSLANTGEERKCKGSGTVKFVLKRSLMYREFSSQDERKSHQLVVPTEGREAVLKLAHDSLMGGHLGIRKTMDRVLSEFYWPGVGMDVTRYCRSCDICQRTISKGKTMKVPLGYMPFIDIPFKRVAVDIVGPIEPMTDRKNRYILTMVDYATRYPEAIALPSIETERVAEALVDMFSRLGVPEEMLTDCGTQFTSAMMKEVSRLLSMKQLTTTPYHPMCNGLVEKFNGTLKQMLRRMCAERPKDWDKFINSMLFAYREVPQESLGFSPFQLLYGRKVRGPMSILKELWSKDVGDAEVKTTYQYVLDLQTRMEETCKMAQDQLRKASGRYRKYYNRKARNRKFVVGNQALVLLPVNHNKLLLQWKGPYEVKQVLNELDYRIDVEGKLRTFHANMLKLYTERDAQRHDGVLTVVCAAVIDESLDTVDDTEEADLGVDMPMVCPSTQGTETVQDVDVSPTLPSEQRTEVEGLLAEYRDVLTDHPGITNLMEHDIKLTTTDPVRVKGYPIPFYTKTTVAEEVSKMLKLGVIEPSKAPFSSPVVMIKKKDGSIRFCIDFRQLNKVTIFDAEPMPNIEEMFSKLSKYKYFSKIDLSKGYWQVPLSESAKEMTAFETSEGLFQFRTMPFGLVNAPATFCRLMRKVLKGLPSTDSFVDDIMIFTLHWNEHVAALRNLFDRLREARLTAKPSKCSIGYFDIECLGHVIGEEHTLKPIPSKVQSVQEATRPRTKKAVKSFLGVVGFYRKFIPNFSAIAVPLTDLTKKGQPNIVEWGEPQDNAFKTLKLRLVGPPILKLPNLDEPFILRTDASDFGLGAVLLQDQNGEKLPVAYASRKLLPRERNYAVIEKECLGVVWGVNKFHRYLYGKEFLLETDHQPLTYLNKAKMANARLMRWALALQPYRMRIMAIPGRENIGADYLSRL